MLGPGRGLVQERASSANEVSSSPAAKNNGIDSAATVVRTSRSPYSVGPERLTTALGAGFIFAAVASEMVPPIDAPISTNVVAPDS